MTMTWQPIETAPKDGTRILCYFPDESAFKILTVVWGYYGWRLDPDGGTEFEFPIEGKPTHWTPLPEKPSI